MNTVSTTTTTDASPIEGMCAPTVRVRGLGDRGNVITVGEGGRVGLGLMRAGQDLNVLLTPDEVDDVIAHLTAAREAARA